ncbi:ATP-binding cassette domain-containing protein [Gordonia pseudamarae]|uniref:ATP-binding cassette domain-containing protein n=1 Tax=Gordonia pseudamarae TaxID=2831662 RepID=A0ABX6IEL9_9ACTN|nr:MULTISPECIES: ATP-binding cassette domain-containing protein [Gordonia]MBD0021977.1 ATP-binding cassette domain-containing protein [Gordonia sp. (in: high G+C Gram-positive bacteria)]QHN24846.1 ATP-binding cassette domain-containing protein [Gordonia pseudamarae]QHN33779.1 ATP-binding cassette domain-containing protein [Gordonia pseudamarae]
MTTTTTTAATDRLALRDGIRAVGVGVRLGGRTIIDDLDLHIPAGQFTGITGESGTGKTTLLRALAGLVAHSGRITYDGSSTARTGALAMLAQHPRQVCNPRWTLRTIITEPAAIAGRDSDAVALAERVGLIPDLLDRQPGQVSDGQLQRACLGRALAQQPDYLLCDEPTAMLDPVAARGVVAILAELAADGVGIVLVSHNLGLVRARCAHTLTLGRTRRIG